MRLRGYRLPELSQVPTPDHPPTRRDGQVMTIAGLSDEWKVVESGELVKS
jgi:hypothetical protein